MRFRNDRPLRPMPNPEAFGLGEPVEKQPCEYSQCDGAIYGPSRRRHQPFAQYQERRAKERAEDNGNQPTSLRPVQPKKLSRIGFLCLLI